MRVGEWLGQHDLQLQGGGGSGVSARTHLPAGLVTFLFTDIEGSTRLAQMLGSQYRSVLAEHREVLRGALSTAQSAELFTEGDSLFMAFPDASAALHACALAQRQLADHVWPVPQVRPLVRMGLHTGYAEPHGGEYASPEARWPIRSPTTPPHAGSCSCSTPATRRSAPPRRWCPSSCAAAPEPRCWPPAGNRSACPARWSGGSSAGGVGDPRRGGTATERRRSGRDGQPATAPAQAAHIGHRASGAVQQRRLPRHARRDDDLRVRGAAPYTGGVRGGASRQPVSGEGRRPAPV